MFHLIIAKEFTDTPGGRYITDGPFSAEEFREKLLYPRYLEARLAEESLTVWLDGSYGYSAGFLEEAFGGLVRVHQERNVLVHMKFISAEDPFVVSRIEEYIHDAERLLQ